jgi:two-component system, cell cycle sensor histidine kinase and response regulator CckA
MDERGSLSSRNARAVEDDSPAGVKCATDRDNHDRLAEKMEAVGMLARGVAHDFNNILSGILGFASYLKAKVKAGSDLHRDLSMIEQSAVRAAELTGQLFLIARRRYFTKESVPINAVINEVLGMIQPAMGSAITLQRKLKTELPPVPGDSAHLKQAILNLCMNAVDAMAEHGGTLTIATDCRMLTPQEREVLHLDPDASRVCVSITDTGREIDADLLKHVFDPFHPVRSKSGKGNLLLSIVYGIVLNHYGDILVESGAEQGTTFRLYLPVAPRDQKGGEESVARLDGTETVLIVDDGAFVCQVVADILKTHGYKVVSSPSGEEALNVLRASKEKIDMVLLDLVMPGMGGEEVFHVIKKMDPKLPILLTSITAQEALGERLIAQGAKGIVYKPYKSNVLLNMVRKVLDDHSPA